MHDSEKKVVRVSAVASYGEMIVAGREARRWDRKELARRLGVKYSSVQRWESNTNPPKRGNAVALQRLLGLPGDEWWSALGATIVPSPEGKVIPGVIEFFSRYDAQGQRQILSFLEQLGTAIEQETQ